MAISYGSEVAPQWRYREEVQELGEKMKAVLGDADERSRQQGRDGGREYELWLTKFKRAAYDVEDVLDELDASKLISRTQSKASLWFFGNNQLLQRMTMPHEMKNVTKKIEEIKEEGSAQSCASRSKGRREQKQSNTCS
ncbi:hypothetical protein VPH35_101674 [Triticum aestivum]